MVFPISMEPSRSQMSKPGEDIFNLVQQKHPLDEQLDIVTNGGAVISLNLLNRPTQGRKMYIDKDCNISHTDIRVEDPHTNAKKLSRIFDTDIITYQDEPNAYYMDLVPLCRIYNFIEYVQHGVKKYEFYNPDKERGNRVDEYTKYVFDHFCKVTQQCDTLLSQLNATDMAQASNLLHKLAACYQQIVDSPDVDHVAFGQQLRKIPHDTPWLQLALEDENIQDLMIASTPRLSNPVIDDIEPQKHHHKADKSEHLLE